MQAYLFVHFREKTTPDGEQVYFAVSKDGFHWESINHGAPVLWSYFGWKGVRDFTITRQPDNGLFSILATDLSISYGIRKIGYRDFWKTVSEQGSRNLVLWQSEDLVHWHEQKMLPVGMKNFGCVWAPDVIYDQQNHEYLLHWSSSTEDDHYRFKKIYYSRTKDFTVFTEPQILYEKPGSSVIDSAMYEENGIYYLFVKSEQNPEHLMLLSSENITGPFTRNPEFDHCMETLEAGKYEAPTAMKLEDGRWCLFLDFYGARGAAQGYVPFLSEDIAGGKFIQARNAFSFPYGFKHGTILTITEEEYNRIRSFDWTDPGYDFG